MSLREIPRRLSGTTARLVRPTLTGEAYTMLDYQSVRTYRDLLQALQKASDEQLDMPIQCTDSHPVDESVYALKQAICLGTVDELDLRYARSVKDNRRHGEELVLFCDGNPFGEDGAAGYVMKKASESPEPAESIDFRDRFEPYYPDDHDESRDWTGPAQELVDQRSREPGRGTLAEILSHRTRGAGQDFFRGASAGDAPDCSA